MAKEQLEKIPEIDLILGINEKNDIVKHLADKEKEKTNMLAQEETMVEVSDVLHQTEFLDFGEVTYTEKTRAVVKVQDGCNQFCSYCIIPYARGRIRSRRPESVIKEITAISKKGIKEVVLTGIHLASYGKDFEKNDALIDLLEKIEKVEGIQRIRLGSLEPTLISEEFVERLSKLSKICDHFHLSLQSGCDETLKRMNRKYTIEVFERGVELLRSAFPNVNLTTDIIVGFPGETKEEFDKTYDFLKKIQFYKMHIFKYSPRKGTVASKMENQIDGNVKEQRSRLLIDLSAKNEEAYHRKYLGRQVEVLWEEENHGLMTGHTKNYMKIQKKKEETTGKTNTMEIVTIQNMDEMMNS